MSESGIDCELSGGRYDGRVIRFREPPYEVRVPVMEPISASKFLGPQEVSKSGPTWPVLRYRPVGWRELEEGGARLVYRLEE